MQPTGLTLDGIVRVSKRGAREVLRSPDQQEADIREWATERGHTIDKVHIAIDESAGHGSHPAIEAAKARALAGDTDGCVSAYLSRFARTVLYGLETVDELLGAGKYFFSVDCPFDLTTPDGERYLTAQLNEARYQWRMYKANFERNVREAVARGVHINVPFGYERSAGRGSPLARCEREAPTVERAAAMRAAGDSWPKIAAELNDKWCPPRPTTRKLKGQSEKTTWQARWTHTTVHQMLKAEVYTGVAHSGEYRKPGAHPALIDPAQWALIKAARGINHNSPDDGYELSGLVRCSACGYGMTHTVERRNGNAHRYYRCKRRKDGCPAPVNIPAYDLEDAVIHRFARDYLTEDAAGEETDTDEREALSALDTAETQYQAVIDTWARARAIRPLTARQLESETREVAAAGDRVTAAEDALAGVRARRRGHDMLGTMTIAKFLAADLPTRRHLMSLMYRAIICRPAAKWREPVSDRFTILAADGSQGPVYGVPLIREIVGLGE